MIIGLKKMLTVVNIVHTEHVRVECIMFSIETYFSESDHSPSDDDCVAALRGTDCACTCNMLLYAWSLHVHVIHVRL